MKLVYRLISLLILISLGVTFFIFWKLDYLSPTIPNINDINTGTGVILNGSNIGEIFRINKDCTYSGDYKSIDIANYDNLIKTPSNRSNYNAFTKNILISGNITEAYICIISDVRDDYKKKGAYNFATNIYIGSKNQGQINVGYNKDRDLVYDNSTDKSNQFLDGKFWGDETPFSQTTDLKEVIIADYKNGGRTTINPIKNLLDGKTIRIGGYVNSYPNYRAGKIIKYTIIYSGGNLSIIN